MADLLRCICLLLAHRVISLLRSNWVALGVKRTSTRAGHRTGFMGTRPSTTLADFEGARDSRISFSVIHGWSAIGGPTHGLDYLGLDEAA